jgi:predicted CXXCH cytochrome family protein
MVMALNSSEIAVVLAALAIAAALFGIAWRRRRRAGAVAAFLVLGIGWGAATWMRQARQREESAAQLTKALPRVVDDGHFSTSASCRECHPREYESWHASFHRRMTQPATPEAVLGDFHGQTFDTPTGTLRLRREANEFWVEMTPTPAAEPASPPEKRETRIVMTTGSHHMQGYWVSRGSGNLLDQLPLMWLNATDDGPGRWVPIGDSFLTPPGMRVDSPWNMSCVLCHSVHGNPRATQTSASDPTTLTADTRVAELGIACEACHGPGGEHVATQRRAGQVGRLGLDDARDDTARDETTHDDTIVQPATLPAARSAEVCGQCHSVAKFANDSIERAWYRDGGSFLPGDELEQSRHTLSPSRMSAEELESLRTDHPAAFESNFWSDGMVRVAGREYNGLIESACYQQGGMTCLTCHTMHRGQPDDQLATAAKTNDVCYQCHANYRDGLADHTHHAAESAGSLCYSCHMPHTTYGLFKGIRAHQVSSPSARTELETGRPNACNLCHLDQPLAWAAEKLTAWYDQPAAELDADQRQISAGGLWLLRGDAVERALAADAAGRSTAWKAAGQAWLPPVLAPLLTDPYSAVRLIAARSLGRLGYADDYDFLAPVGKRAEARRGVLKQWRRDAPLAGVKRHASGLFDEDGDLREEAIERLLSERDDHPVQISE